MIKLAAPDIDNINLLNLIISGKRKEDRLKLLEYQKDIMNRYGYYEENFDSLEKIKPETERWTEIHQALLGCYKSNGKAFKEAREKIMQTAGYKCPYCLLGASDTLDHYFDKNAYPEFSVFAPNLIPCCSRCNSIKGVNMFTEDNHRRYIHFYIDNITDQQVLFVQFLADDGDIPKINIFLKDGVERLLEEHFNSLSLIKRYKHSLNEEISEVIQKIQAYHKTGMAADDIKNLLIIEYKILKGKYGINYWKACIYDGLINSSEYMKIIVSDWK